ncbi:FtsX-like permease family protein [Fannyhessea vaginae]|uniref:FtsX-like permease family protein n=1 Tax=Fannyhessea vaginae TaxID=82135 RepID=UPI00288C350D|nr:FtsX-like permease family protein [Fannyhessea vaginae]
MLKRIAPLLHQTLRSIHTTLSRFLAIVAIVALGTGFFAGLMMTGPDMRQAMDTYYDDNNVWDIRLISTLGFSNDDIHQFDDVEGVRACMPNHTVDAIARMNDTQVAVRVSSFDTTMVQQFIDEHAYAAKDSSSDFLNRFQLVTGRLPQSPDECLAAAYAPHAQLSEGDIVDITSANEDLDKIFSTRHLRVVGTITSPLYPYTRSFGSTTIGSGSIDQYIFVPTSTFQQDFPYTELYISVEGADSVQSNSSAYKNIVGATKERLEAQKDRMSVFRQHEVQELAQSKLDEKKTEFEQQKNEAFEKLEAGESELERKHSKLQESWRKYTQGTSKLKASREAFESQKAASQNKLSQAQTRLATQEETLISTLRAQGIDVSSLEQAQTVLESHLQALKEKQNQQNVDNRVVDENSSEQSPEHIRSNSKQQLATLDDYRQSIQHDKTRAIMTTAREHVSAPYEEIQRVQQQLAGVQALIAAKAKLQDERAVADKKLEHAEQELAQAQAKLDASYTRLQEGQKKYDEGAHVLAQRKQELDDKFATVQKQLDDAQETIDTTDLPDMYILDRSQHEGAAIYHADTERMDALARVFPFMFFLVAALVSLTTMTRMVEDERILIGTYKALGYSTIQIATKYLIYALLAAGIGSVLGVGVLCQVLPLIIMKAYSVIYAIPLLPPPLPIKPDVAVFSAGLGIGITLIATICSVLSSLREQPAPLMLPRAPKAGKRILLERIRPLWRRISFSWKVTLRNLFLYKKRLFMTVIGIAGCTALLLVGFGLHDAIWDIINKQYVDITHYQMTVGLNDHANDLDVQHVKDVLTQHPEIEHIDRVHTAHMSAKGEDDTLSSTHVDVVVPQSLDIFNKSITLKNRISGKQVPFDESSVVISEKLATLHHLRVGDTLVLFDRDKVGNSVGAGHKLTITGICENYVGTTVYVAPAIFAKISSSPVMYETLFIQAPDLKPGEQQQNIASELHSCDDVSLVAFSDETISLYRNMISVVDYVVAVLIISAVLLAFIVLYNLTNINIEERLREIASLKVLGFTKREIYAYIFREVFLLSLLGDVFGLGVGVYLERFVVATAEVDYVMFSRTIHLESFVIAFVLTLVFTGLILLVMTPKLNRIDMVESLKSVD